MKNNAISLVEGEIEFFIRDGRLDYSYTRKDYERIYAELPSETFLEKEKEFSRLEDIALKKWAAKNNIELVVDTLPAVFVETLYNFGLNSLDIQNSPTADIMALAFCVLGAYINDSEFTRWYKDTLAKYPLPNPLPNRKDGTKVRKAAKNAKEVLK